MQEKTKLKMSAKHSTDSLVKSANNSTKTPSTTSIFLKATLLSLLIAFIMLIITSLGVLGYGYSKLNQFAQKSGTTIPELKTLIKTALNTPPKQTNGYKTILLLGVDTVANKPNDPQLTDTMLLLSVNMNSGKINTLSLPRDLWSTDYQTRINALYEYGKSKYPDRPEQFPEEVVSQLTGVSINHTVTLKLNTVSEIIDILGGIDVDVTEGFIDSEFPREDVDLETAQTNTELYETVQFKPGLQHMDGKTALKYIRSRKSMDISQGTDVARSIRQQEVISALIQKAQDFSILTNTNALAELYKLYNITFEKQFAKQEAISTINYLLRVSDNITLAAHTPSIYPDNKNGVIVNPPQAKYQGQWVYEIRNLNNFQNEVQKLLRE